MARYSALLFLLALMFVNSAPAQEYTPDSNTVLLWHMNEVMPGNYASDASGNNRNGHIEGGTGPLVVPGVFGNAISLNGAYITIWDNPALDFGTSPFTIELWVKAYEPQYPTLQYRPSDGAYGIWFYSNHDLYFSISGENQNAAVFTPGASVVDGEWHHIAGVRDTYEIRLYIDGNLKASSDASSVGALRSEGSQVFFGYPDIMAAMDEIRISNKARTAAEFNVSIRVDIDVRPEDSTNTINLGSAGVVPVAILGSAALDVTNIDPSTVSLAGARVKLVGKTNKYLCHVEDVNRDRIPDLLCQVQTAQFMIEPGDSIAVLEAETYLGKRLRGQDSVRIVP